MKYIYIDRSPGYVTRYVNFDAVRFLWIDELDKDFCERNDFADSRFSVMAEHGIHLASFPTEAEAEKYLADLVGRLNRRDSNETTD